MKYQKSLYSDLTESGNERASEFTRYNAGTAFMEHLRHELSGDELIILDNIETMSNSQLATRLKVDINRLNYLKRKLVEKILKYKNELGGDI